MNIPKALTVVAPMLALPWVGCSDQTHVMPPSVLPTVKDAPAATEDVPNEFSAELPQRVEEAVQAEFLRTLEKAKVGDPVAQNDLGVMYELGVAVVADPTEAANWYQKAAEQGVDVAQFNLAVMCANGTGVVQDDGQALLWFRMAANQGYADA